MKITLADSYGEVIEALGNESLGILFRAIYHKSIGKTPFIVDAPADVKLAYREFEKYLATQKKRSEAGQKGGNATFASSKTDKTEDLLQAKHADEEPIYTSTEDSTRVLNTTLLKSLDGTEDSSRKLNTTSPKASDGNSNSDPVYCDREVLGKWHLYLHMRTLFGKKLSSTEENKAMSILQEKSGGDPEKAKAILQKSIDRITEEQKKEHKPKNRTNNFFDFDQRKPGDHDYKDLDAIVRKEV